MLIGGQHRKLNISGTPSGRTVIVVDGTTVYNKKPFLPKQLVEFQVIPGKTAKMRLHQVSPLKMECDILVDDESTTLPSIGKDSSARPLVGAHARRIFETRSVGAGMLAFAGFSFWLNRNELMYEDRYYPKLLSLIPGLILMGVLLLGRPEWADFSPKNKVMVVGTMVLTMSILLFGYTLFTDWFISAYGH